MTAGVDLLAPGALKTVIAGSLMSVMRSTLSPLEGSSRSTPVGPWPGILPVGHKVMLVGLRPVVSDWAQIVIVGKAMAAARMAISGLVFIMSSRNAEF